MPFAEVSGARLYWKMEGLAGAPPLVLLNSIGTDMDLWDRMLPALRDHFTLLRLDTRGHGASTAAPGDWSMTLLADDVQALCDAVGLERFAVAGVSLGGMIGMTLALRQPERVEKLALICTSATMDKAAWSARVEKVRAEGMASIADLAMGRFLSDGSATDDPSLYQTVRRNLLTMDAQGYAGCAAAIRDMNLADQIGSITCPTLVVTGSRDSSTPLEGHGDHLLARIPGALHQPLEAAHLAPLEAPDTLSRALISFFQG